MCDNDNLENESEQPHAKKAKPHYVTQSSDSSQEENNKKQECQQRYREQNRKKLKQRDVERRKHKQNVQIIAEPSTSSITNRLELNNEEITDANSQSLSGLEGTKKPSFQENEQSKKHIALQKKRKRQQRYREQNRDKLKRREAERRRRKQNSDIAEASNSLNIDFLEIINEAIIDEIILEDGKELIMVVVYISPNKTMEDIISFLHERLFLYSCRGATIFKSNKHELPLILAGDFNINFAKDESLPLITFLQKEFELQINNDPREYTTRYGTTIDAVFTRYLDNVMSNTLVSYFSDHRPVVTVMPSEATSDIAVTEVTD